MRALFISPHPDDAEIHAGGTIARLVREGHKVFCFIVSGKGTPRESEARQSMQTLGVHTYEIREFPDRLLYTRKLEIIQAIERFATALEPDVVFTNFYADSHQDHITVAKCVAAACRKVSSLCYYQPTFPSGRATQPFTPNLFVELEAEDVGKKLKALKYHASQLIKYGEGEWIESNKAILQANAWMYLGKHGFAEVFQVQRLAIGRENLAILGGNYDSSRTVSVDV